MVASPLHECLNVTSSEDLSLPHPVTPQPALLFTASLTPRKCEEVEHCGNGCKFWSQTAAYAPPAPVLTRGVTVGSLPNFSCLSSLLEIVTAPEGGLEC